MASSNDSTDRPGDQAAPQPEALETLRRIIVGPETDRLGELERRLDDPVKRTEETSRILPDAISLSLNRDRRLAGSLRATIEDSIHDSVRKDPKVLADAIFPLMGPGIRRAIAAAIMGMIQNFNQLLNHSFSIQGIKWRIEALRTNRSYAEIVLLHTLIYQVEQVFLIHRSSGLVLQHISAGGQHEDPDMVSGMLTAIENFVTDSFGGPTEQGLDTLRIGNQRSIWIEQGSKAYMAVILRGTPPLSLRQRVAEALISIHIRFQNELEDYQGDTLAFESAREELGTLLDTEFKPARQKTSPLFWLSVAVLVGLLLAWVITGFQFDRRCERLLEKLRLQPGVVVGDVEKNIRHMVVRGLKDPLADDSTPFISETGLHENQVALDFRPFASLDPVFVLERARQALDPPSTVQLQLRNGLLVATGSAGHRWIKRFKTAWPALPGIGGIAANNLADLDREALGPYCRRLEQIRILFPFRSVAFADGQEQELESLVKTIGELDRLSKRLETVLSIRIQGYTDDTGGPLSNLEISGQRAQNVFRYLVQNTNANITLNWVGMGIHPSIDMDIPIERKQALCRCVVFKLIDDGSRR